MKTGFIPRKLLCLSLAGLATASHDFLIPPFPADEPSTLSPFDWNTLESYPGLSFKKCYDQYFECAKLTVPLDWNDPSNPNNMSLAIVRVPASVDRADESYGGVILVNPGGPGGSGTDIVISAGRSIQKIVDSDKHFDILSFDPRGIKFTSPNVACFQDDSARQVLAILGVGVGGLDGSPDALNVKWSIDQGLGLLCEQSGYFEDGSNIHQYVSTALVARDMVEIIDRVDEHLKMELESQPSSSHDKQHPLFADSVDNLPLLNYWGLSYGTYLGNTFASLYPERVGRVILDGVVDADDYAATGWTTNLRDNAKTWSKFFEYCFDAGPRCALYSPSHNSAEDIHKRIDNFLEDLKENPIPVILNGNASVLTLFVLKAIIHGTLYSPNAQWPLLAEWLHAFDTGDLSTAVSIMQSGALWDRRTSHSFVPAMPPLPGITTLLSAPSEDSAQSIQIGYPWSLEAGVSILCGDGDDITSHTKVNHTDYLALLQSQSEIDAAVWAEIILHCIHWPKALRPISKNRFTGPFQSKLSDYNPRGSPLLFIGNTADPVTPVYNARKMSERHEGSVVLTQNVPGHCSTDNNPSTCLFPVVRAFFANGTLPEPDLVCEGIRKPWDVV